MDLRVPRRSGIALVVGAAPAHVAALVTVAVVAGTMPAAATLAIQRFVNGAVSHAGAAQLGGTALLFALTAVVGSIAPNLSDYLTAQCSRAAGFVITERLYTKVGAEPGIELLEQPAYQDRVERATDSADLAPTQVLGSGIYAVECGVTTVTLAMVMLSVSRLAALLAIVGTIPVILLEGRLANHRIRMRYELAPIDRRREAIRTLIVDPVAGKEIRLFGLSSFFRARMLVDLRRANGAAQRLDRSKLAAQLAIGLVDVALTVGVVVLVITTGSGVSRTAGGIIAAISAFAGLGGALTGLVTQAFHYREGRALLASYDEVMAALPVRAAATGPVSGMTAELAIEDVWFRYGENLPWILAGVTMTLRAGEATALVGLNGSGKSTLVKLICGLYQPTRGRIRWDGMDIATLDPSELRERIGAVFQDFMTYDLNAHDNVAVGSIDRRDDRDAIRRAAVAAGIDRTLSDLPAGYDTMLSRLFYSDPTMRDDDRRVVLSGGQWQRVALARMLMRQGRDLMILDEPSAGLDPQAEAEVHHSIVTTMRGVTRLLVSHRLSAVRFADQICVLDRGRIAERGAHHELVDHDGIYAALFATQAAGYTNVSGVSTQSNR